MGALPFDSEGTVTEQGGAVVRAGVAVSVWRLPAARVTSAGKTYDYTGEAEGSAADVLVDHPNRHLVLGDRDFVIVGANEHLYLPHVELRLRLMLAGG